jgi:hypothetical protein
LYSGLGGRAENEHFVACAVRIIGLQDMLVKYWPLGGGVIEGLAREPGIGFYTTSENEYYR